MCWCLELSFYRNRFKTQSIGSLVFCCRRMCYQSRPARTRVPGEFGRIFKSLNFLHRFAPNTDATEYRKSMSEPGLRDWKWVASELQLHHCNLRFVFRLLIPLSARRTMLWQAPSNLCRDKASFVASALYPSPSKPARPMSMEQACMKNATSGKRFLDSERPARFKYPKTGPVRYLCGSNADSTSSITVEIAIAFRAS